MRAAVITMTVAIAVFLILNILTTIGHILTADWEQHAQFHLFREMYLGLAMAVCGFALTYGPFRSGELWGWQALLVWGLFVFIGPWVGFVVMGHGGEGMMSYVRYINHGIQLAIFVAAMLLWKRAAKQN